MQSLQIPPEAVWSVKTLVAESGRGGGEDTEVTPEAVARLARLSHLPLTTAESKRVQSEIQSLLHFVRIVQDVDTEGVEPMESLLEWTELDLRADVVVRRATTKQIMANAPEVIEGYFVAPKEGHFETSATAAGDPSGDPT
jgi:aspartyl-tRNA(Asn)/glutamyl-tRNA(Gln) amidotransferase subunit C